MISGQSFLQKGGGRDVIDRSFIDGEIELTVRQHARRKNIGVEKMGRRLYRRGALLQVRGGFIAGTILKQFPINVGSHGETQARLFVAEEPGTKPEVADPA